MIPKSLNNVICTIDKVINVFVGLSQQFNLQLERNNLTLLFFSSIIHAVLAPTTNVLL